MVQCGHVTLLKIEEDETRAVHRVDPGTRWSTTLSSQVDLPVAIDCRAFCGADLVFSRSKFRKNETCELHHVEPENRKQVTGSEWFCASSDAALGTS